jgi:hypothetical protein
MYYITYKNILKPDKKLCDFENWLQAFWLVQQKWGAKSYKLWKSGDLKRRVLFCRYTVENLDRWNESAMSLEAEPLVRALGEVVDIYETSIKITVLKLDSNTRQNS